MTDMPVFCGESSLRGNCYHKICITLLRSTGGKRIKSVRPQMDTLTFEAETLTIKAAPLPGGMVKAKTGDSTDAAVYNG